MTIWGNILVMDYERLHEEAYRWEIVVALMRDHGDALTRYCRTWLGEALAEEVTLEVFIAAFDMLPRYQPEATLRAWLFGIAKLKCLQEYRNRTRRQAIIEAHTEEIRAGTQGAAPSAPGESLEHKQLLARLKVSLDQLPREDRLLVILRYWRDLPLAEIAEMMRLSPRAIRKRLQRAEQCLKELMDAPSKT
jgi:RNA polymerase sigma-70 factor (ECF subfamily)